MAALLVGVTNDLGQSVSIIPNERLVIVINSAWHSAVGRELFVARSAFINAVRAAAKGL